MPPPGRLPTAEPSFPSVTRHATSLGGPGPEFHALSSRPEKPEGYLPLQAQTSTHNRKTQGTGRGGRGAICRPTPFSTPPVTQHTCGEGRGLLFLPPLSHSTPVVKGGDSFFYPPLSHSTPVVKGGDSLFYPPLSHSTPVVKGGDSFFYPPPVTQHTCGAGRGLLFLPPPPVTQLTCGEGRGLLFLPPLSHSTPVVKGGERIF